MDPSLPVAMANNTPAVRAAILASTVMPSAATTDSDGGRNWSNGHWRQSIYNHVTPPNSKSVKRGTGQSSDGGVPATSHHPGGVNVLMADGATRFVKESVSADVWAAVGGRKDGITLSLSNL